MIIHYRQTQGEPRIAAVHPPRRPPSSLAIVLVGLAALASAMGVGRFAFTPLLPLMQAHEGLSLGQGAWLASANYLGYCGRRAGLQRRPAGPGRGRPLRPGRGGGLDPGDGCDRELRGLAAPATRRRGRERLRSRRCLRLGDRVAGRMRPCRLVGRRVLRRRHRHRRRWRRRTRRRTRRRLAGTCLARAGGDEQRSGGASPGCRCAPARRTPRPPPRRRSVPPAANGG